MHPVIFVYFQICANLIPSAVKPNEPKTCKQVVIKAMPQRCACIKPTISTEKPENVVKLPRKPVIQSKRH